MRIVNVPCKGRWGRRAVGSITVYLCLALAVLLALLFAAYRSAAMACSRVMVESGLEQGLYSVFGSYDRDLWETYGILGVDGGYGSSALQLKYLLDEVEGYAEDVTHPFGSDLFGLSRTSRSVTGYRLLTDGGGAGFHRQICQLMEDRLGADLIESLTAKVKQDMEDADRAEKEYKALEPAVEEAWNSVGEGGTADLPDTENTVVGYAKTDSGNTGKTLTEEKISGASGEILLQPPAGQTLLCRPAARAVPSLTAVGDSDVIFLPGGEAGSDASLTLPEATGEEDAEAKEQQAAAALESFKAYRKLGIYSICIDEPSKLSNRALDPEEVVSGRDLNSGLAAEPEKETGLISKYMVCRYLQEYFGCYTEQKEGEGIRYQVEYAIGGKKSDADNLRSVLNRISVIREAANFLYLYRDPEKSAEAENLATVISLLLLQPELQPPIAMALKSAWAYAETIQDIKVLLAGGKIPILKSADTWKTGLFSFLNPTKNSTEGAKTGLTYREYLTLLLMTKGEDELTLRAMDLVEYCMRYEKGRSAFRLDCCLDSVEVEFEMERRGKALQITRGYQYDEERS